MDNYWITTTTFGNASFNYIIKEKKKNEKH